MASHHAITIRPRSLSNVLLDLKEAKRDYDDAQDELRNATLGMAYGNQDADDRCTEADTRLEDLRDEFDARLIDATGLSFEALMAMREGCLL